MKNNVDKCTKCGFCKFNCPVFKITLKETFGPRGKAILINKNILNEIFNNCTLCKACKFECPLGIDLEIDNIREKMIKQGIETEANKKMIENIRKYGNPFGKIEKGKIPKELYCC